MRLIKRIIAVIARCVHPIYNYTNSKQLSNLKDMFYSERIKLDFRSAGKDIRIKSPAQFDGTQFIVIGNHVRIGRNAVISAWWNENNQSPFVTIGDDCNIGDYVHISAYDGVSIGEGTLIGRWVTITDNGHGDTISSMMDISPMKRPIVTKGEIVIGKNVWIGDKATILPGVEIGDGAVIAANAVVTKNVPSKCVVAGSPAHIVKDCRD